MHTIGCNLHWVELPFKHISKSTIGVSPTPGIYKGPLADQLTGDIHLQSVTHFTAIKTSNKLELSEEFIEDLSNDQRLLYECYKAVTTGKISEEWLGRRIGPMTEARWMTRSIRVLALYTRKQNPSDSVIDLVKFIIHIYVPGWFSIKQSIIMSKV